MQPPPFEPGANMPRQKKSNTLLFAILGGVLVCCVLPIGGLVLAGRGLFGAVAPIAECAITVQGMKEGLDAYAEANGASSPPPQTWQTAIGPYYTKAIANEGQENVPIKIPTATEAWGCGSGADRHAFVFNTELAGKTVADIKNPGEQVVVFEQEGTPAVNKSARYDPKTLGKQGKVFNTPRGFFGVSAAFTEITIAPDGTISRGAKVRAGTKVGTSPGASFQSGFEQGMEAGRKAKPEAGGSK